MTGCACGRFLGLACLGFGGNGLQITSFHISNLFRNNEKLVVSLITGAFAASSCLFTFVRLGYERMGWDLHLQFSVYAGMIALVTLSSSVYPSKPFTCPEDLECEDDPDDKSFLATRRHALPPPTPLPPPSHHPPTPLPPVSPPSSLRTGFGPRGCASPPPASPRFEKSSRAPCPPYPEP